MSASADIEAAGAAAASTAVRILGVEVSTPTLDEVVHRIIEAGDRGERLRVHFVTAHTLVEAQTRPALRDALNTAHVVAPDGMPLVWIGRRRGHRLQRVCGPDTFPRVLDAGRERGLRHYFYGGPPGLAQSLAHRMSRRYPGLAVAGWESPPFRPLTAAERVETASRINAARPDCIWVGLGSPKQDLWATRFRDELEAGAVLTVGAAFDFLAGTQPRAPMWMQRSGLEWVHRLANDPRRLLARYTLVNARFAGLVAREETRRWSSRRGRPPTDPGLSLLD